MYIEIYEALCEAIPQHDKRKLREILAEVNYIADLIVKNLDYIRTIEKSLARCSDECQD